MTFSTWIDTFIEEKGLNRGHLFTKQGREWGENIIPLDAVIEAMKTAPASEQKAIKDTVVKIDFMNGDVMHFFDHLAGALAI